MMVFDVPVGILQRGDDDRGARDIVLDKLHRARDQLAEVGVVRDARGCLDLVEDQQKRRARRPGERRNRNQRASPVILRRQWGEGVLAEPHLLRTTAKPVGEGIRGIIGGEQKACDDRRVIRSDALVPQARMDLWRRRSGQCQGLAVISLLDSPSVGLPPRRLGMLPKTVGEALQRRPVLRVLEVWPAEFVDRGAQHPQRNILRREHDGKLHDGRIDGTSLRQLPKLGNDGVGLAKAGSSLNQHDSLRWQRQEGIADHLKNGGPRLLLVRFEIDMGDIFCPRSHGGVGKDRIKIGTSKRTERGTHR
jgi:hypothetical protein